MGRTPCCEKNGLKKGPWTAEEDEKLMAYIEKHGHGNWRTLPKNAGLARCGKSCRLRWTNYLRPDIKRGRFSFEEEETIIQLHSILGNKWSAIAARLPGRTDNEIKNYWNTHIRKRLLRMGIDPVTHSPRLDLLDLSTLLANPSLYNAGQLDVPRLFGIEPLVNSEILRIAAGLINQNFQEPQHANNEFQLAQGLSWFNDAQLVQSNVDQFETGHDQINIAPVAYTGYENLEQSVPNLVPDDRIQNYNLSASVLSTPVSSSTQLNSWSTTYFDGVTEDEKDSYCSQLLKFQVPEDLSEFM